ncbi:nitrogen fixation protein NifZ [Sulfurospirillum barnesii]|uniref:NifZ domain-containing protein n=1 Tax=Sulfurospirillum barnesii (strain ATCC 700032 / DSM 10660 / SES-3) TaxID=760154 RepID=I3XWI7_SULBS|nr:nitrogen fixation protein NifZ [Sulfurospirillum barnesii]AFL68311.1 NifZ domain-containing protein [Sulfurospirillum barnesii SES-3]
MADVDILLHNSVMAKLSSKDEERAKFFLGQKVKLLEDVKNDGTYPYLPVGSVMIEKGSQGYIRSIGDFLQVIRVYEVHFLDSRAEVEIIGCREHELEALEPYRDLEAEEYEWMMNYSKQKSY